MSNIIKKGPEVLKRIEKELASADCDPFETAAMKTDAQKQDGGAVASSDGLGELSCRAANCLSNAGIETKEQARQAITEGRLKPDKKRWKLYSTNEDRGVRNYGWKTHKEVCKWAGLPEPQKPKRVQICPHCGKDVICSSNAPDQRPGELPNTL